MRVVMIRKIMPYQFLFSAWVAEPLWNDMIDKSSE
jgi:hypothetical protein